jgi:hypothetical protein
MLKDYFEVPNKPAIKSGNILSCDFTDHETFIPQPLDFTRNTSATYIDCNGFIAEAGIDIPRIDYLTEIGKAKELQKPSLLLEPQSTNLVTFSEDFSGYTTNNSSILSNVISSPDGSLSASKLIENTATAEHTIQKQVSVTSGNAYSISVFVKKPISCAKYTQ